MPSVIRTFDERRTWGNADNDFRVKEWLPRAMVLLHRPGSIAPIPLLAVVDTGAQHLMLPASVAPMLGIDLSTCSSKEVRVASGARHPIPYAQIQISARGVRASVRAYFGEGWNPPLLGVEAIYATMIFSIDREGSLYGRPRRSGGLVIEMFRYFKGLFGG